MTTIAKPALGGFKIGGKPLKRLAVKAHSVDTALKHGVNEISFSR